MAWIVDQTITGSELDTVTVTPVVVKTCMMILYHMLTNPNTTHNIRFNADSGSNYSARRCADFGADTTVVSQTSINIRQDVADTSSVSAFIEVVNISAEEKLVICHTFSSDGINLSGTETIGKWANTSSQITSVSAVNTSTGGFESGSLLAVIGDE